MSVKIIVDSTCDFEPEERQALGIEMIPLTVQFGEEIFRDGIDITKEEFFQRLRASKELPHTSQINPATFLEVYERLGADGSELLVMTISKNLSGTYQSACVAAEQYTGKIRVVDSSLATTAFAMMVRIACRMRDEGHRVDEIADYLEKIRERLVIICCMNTLEYLHKGGRLSATVTILGGMLNIKPVVLIKDGHISILHKARGIKAAARWMVDYVAETGFDASLPIGFIHSDNPEGAVEVRSMLAEKATWGEEMTRASAGHRYPYRRRLCCHCLLLEGKVNRFHPDPVPRFCPADGSFFAPCGFSGLWYNGKSKINYFPGGRHAEEVSGDQRLPDGAHPLRGIQAGTGDPGGTGTGCPAGCEPYDRAQGHRRTDV